MIEKQVLPQRGKVKVTFRVSRSVWADQIALVGDFNGWDGSESPLVCTCSDPDWHITLELDAGRRYRFGYLMDGAWNSDHDADGDETDDNGHVYSVVDTSPRALVRLHPALAPVELLHAA